MAKKIVKKKKLKVFNLLLILIVTFGIFFGVYTYLKLPIKNLVVNGNSYLNDDYILSLSGLKDYPSFWLTSMNRGEKKLKKSNYIVNAKIKRGFKRVITIEVEENIALFSKENENGKIVFSNGEELNVNDSLSFRVPRLMNYVPSDQYKDFVKGMKIIKSDILQKISDIEYVPNDIDKERFLLYMDDGNMVYLTLTKFKMINYYNDVLEQLEDKHGILYLDNGNHFQIKE